MNQGIEKSCQLTQVQNMLRKNTFLSNQSTPGYLDALIFKLFNEAKSNLNDKSEIPDRSTYSNLYHWFIMMKQFSPAIIQKWMKEEQQLDNPIISQLLELYHSAKKKSNQASTINKTPKQQLGQQKAKQQILELKVYASQIQQVHSKLNHYFPKQQSNINNRLETIENISDSEIKLTFLTDEKQSQKIKQQILKWDQIIHIQIKRCKKQSTNQIDES